MAKLAKIRLVFDRRNESKVKGYGELSYYCYFANKKVAFIPTGVKILPSEWDKKKNEINSEHSNHLKLNNYFRNKLNDFLNYEIEYLQKNGEILTKERLYEFIEDASAESFIGFAKNQIKIADISNTTAQSQNRSIAILEEFGGKVTFSEINESLVVKLTKWMKDKDYSQNTIWKVHKDIRTHVNKAIRAHKLQQSKNPYLTYKVQKDVPKHKYLNYEELGALENLTVPQGEMRIYLDSFLFQCYTGLRISDIEILSGKNIFMQGDHLVLSLERMVKVNRSIFQNLHLYMEGKAEKLIKPYWVINKDKKYIWGRRVTEQKSNEYLKLFQAEAEIEKLLTTHVGRHTFGTIMAKETGKPFLLMEYMGISKLSTINIYVKLGAQL